MSTPTGHDADARRLPDACSRRHARAVALGANAPVSATVVSGLGWRSRTRRMQTGPTSRSRGVDVVNGVASRDIRVTPPQPSGRRRSPDRPVVRGPADRHRALLCFTLPQLSENVHRELTPGSAGGTESFRSASSLHAAGLRPACSSTFAAHLLSQPPGLELTSWLTAPRARSEPMNQRAPSITEAVLQTSSISFRLRHTGTRLQRWTSKK